MSHVKDDQATAELRADFERLANGEAACGFKRSRLGTYVNPSIARDWKWFQLGAISLGKALPQGEPVAFYNENWTLTPRALAEGKKRYGDQVFYDMKPAYAAHESARPVLAPWPDFKGNPIYHGSRLRHPDGTSFVAMRLHGFTQETDAWRAIYDGLEPSGLSRLCLQIGDKGQATIVPEEIQQ